MPCENYREALTEAAATDSAPSREVRSHLDACASCRTAFAEEQQLFAAIDTGVRAAANAEVPPTFLPSVRASLENVSGSERRWMPFLIFAAASAAIVLAIFIPARARHAIYGMQARQNFSVPLSEKPVTGARSEASETPAVAVSPHLYRAAPRRSSAQVNFASSTQPEVLVPSEEREAFARFISSQQKRTEVVVAVETAALDEEDNPPSMKPLLIAKLVVRPLERLESEAPDGTEEEQ